MRLIVVENAQKKRLIVQPAVIPAGYKFVEDYKEPREKAIQTVGDSNAGTDRSAGSTGSSQEDPAN